MGLYDKIIELYPDLTIDDFVNMDGIVLMSDGYGNEHIAKWNHPTLTKPTDEQLAVIGAA